MERYWPQHKVFFVATLALFPDTLKDKNVTLYFYGPYFARDDVNVIELTLQEYQSLNLLKYEKTSEGVFHITSVNSLAATDALEAYLQKWQGDELAPLFSSKKVDSALPQHDRLMSALAEAYKAKIDRHQRLTLKDIYGEPSSDYFGTPFWELVLSMHFADDPIATIDHIGYDRLESGTYPKDTQPYVDFTLSVAQHRSLELAAKSSEPLSQDDPQELEYKDILVGRDGLISYKGEHIGFTAQQREVMRVFLRRPEELRTKDDFIYSDIFPYKDYKDIETTLSKLIALVHKKLRASVGEKCIFNTPGQGWFLKLP